MAAAVAPRLPTASASGSPPRAGKIRDRGSVRRDSVRAADWSTTGMAKVQGDVDVGNGRSSGLLSVAGKLSAQTLRSDGSLEVVGFADVRDRCTLGGTAHFGAGLHAGDLGSRGTVRSDGEIRVDRELSANGVVEAPNARAGLFELSGSAEIPGDLVALASVRARFRGDSRLGTVRARRVELQGPPTGLLPTLLRAVFGGSATVRVDRVEADSVALSAVDVEFVRARAIDLGPGAHVTTLEGTVVRQAPSSRVGPESRSPRPYGLSR